METVILNDVVNLLSLPEDFLDEGYSLKIEGDVLKTYMYDEVIVVNNLSKQFIVKEKDGQKYIILDGMCLVVKIS